MFHVEQIPKIIKQNDQQLIKLQAIITLFGIKNFEYNIEILFCCTGMKQQNLLIMLGKISKKVITNFFRN